MPFNLLTEEERKKLSASGGQQPTAAPRERRRFSLLTDDEANQATAGTRPFPQQRTGEDLRLAAQNLQLQRDWVSSLPAVQAQRAGLPIGGAQPPAVQEATEQGGVNGLLNRVADISEMFTGRLLSDATMGLSGALDRILGYIPPEPKTTVEKIVAGAGGLVGAAVPITGLYKTIGAAAGKLVPKAATGLAARVGRAALPGAATGAAYEGARSTIEGDPAAEVGKEAALGAALFGGGDIALRALGKGVGAAWEKLPQATREALLKRVGLLKTEPPVPVSAKPAEQLSLPAPEAQLQLTGPVAGEQRLLNAPQNFTFRDMTTEEVVGRVVPKGPKLLPEPQQNFELQGEPLRFSTKAVGPIEKTAAKAKPPVKPEDQELLSLFQTRGVTLDNALTKVRQEYDKLVQQQVEYLKTSGGQGVEAGGLMRDEAGDVVGRFGRMSNNPQWYRDFYAQHGRAPRQSEYKELALEQLRNGFMDDLAEIPPDKSFLQVENLLNKVELLRQDYPADIIQPSKKRFDQIFVPEQRPAIDTKYESQYNSEQEIKKQLRRYYSAFDDEEGLDAVAGAIADLRKTENTIQSTGRGNQRRTDRGTRGRSEQTLDDGRRQADGVQGKPYKTVGLSFSQDLIDTGRVNLTGHKINKTEDLAVIAQVFRDPRFETFRIVYTKGNQIVGTDAISSRLPGTSIAVLDSPAKHFTNAKMRMQRLGADGYYLVHNHPTGLPKPSRDDVSLTWNYAKKLPGFKEHIVINSSKYSSIYPEYQNGSLSGLNGREDLSLNLGEDRLLKPSTDHPLLGHKISNPEDLALLAKATQSNSDLAVAFFMDGQLRVKGIQEINKGMLNDVNFKKFLRNQAREHGGSASFIVGDSSIATPLMQLVARGDIADAFIKDTGESLRNFVNVNKEGHWMGLDVGKEGRGLRPPKPKADKTSRMLEFKPAAKTQEQPLALPAPDVNFTLKDSPLQFRQTIAGPLERGVAVKPPEEALPLRFKTEMAVPRGTERAELPRILAGIGTEQLQPTAKAVPKRIPKGTPEDVLASRPENGTLGFAGRRQTTAAPTAGQGEVTPVQRRSIVKYLEKQLDIPIRVGRYQHRTALGIYKIKPEVIRTRLAEDLEVISHEVGHHLDKQLGLVKSGFDDEMKKLAAEVKGNTRTEGVAQFMNFYLTDPAKAKARAPRYYEAFEQKLAQYPEIAEVLDTAQQQIKTWLTQPSKARVLGSLSVDQGTPKRPMTVDRLYTMAIDELRPLEKAVKDITKGTKINVNKDPFIAAWLSRGWRGKAETALHHGQLDENLKKIGPSLDEIMKPVEKNLDDFRAYITSKRSLELSGRGIETGIEAADAGRALQEIEQELGSEAVKKFEGAFKSLVDFQDYILNRLVKSGMVGKDAAKTIRDMNRDYVPFYRLFDDSVGTLQFQGKTYANLSTPIKRLKGSGRTIIDPLESVIKNTFAFTNLAERNDVGRLFVELAESFGGSGKWIEKVATPMNATKFQLNEIEKALTDAGVNVTGVDLNKMAAIFRPGIFPAGKENIVTVYRNGRPEFFQLDPELYRAMLFLDKESSNILTKALSYPASVLRAGATLTPEFMARNPVRDQFSAFINSKYGFIPGVDLIKGLGHVLKKDELYWKWYQSGGAHSAFVSVDRDYLQKNLRTMLQKDLKSRAGRVVKNPLELLRALSEMTEEATRVQEFALGLKKGASPKEAALASRDITLDFGRAGTIGKEANRYITFLNSALQGADKMVRQWKSQPGKATFRAVSSITLPSVILYMVNRDNPYYQEVPQWEKDIYWMVPYNGGKNFIRIPKPFELGILFGTVPERFLAWADKEDPNAFKDLAKTVKEYVFLDMLPDKDRGFGPGGIIPPGLLPTAFVPMLEVWANKSTFTGYPIIPQREQNLPPEMQYGPYTSEVAKLAGKATGTSPRAIEQAAFGYTAGLGRNSAALADWGLDKLGVVERTPKPAGELTDIPLIRGFISRNPTAGQSQSIDQFYEMYNETEQLYTAIRKKTEAGQPAPELNQQERNQLQKLKVMRRLAGNLSDLRKTSLQIQENKTISPQKKREALDILDLRQINLIRQAFGKEALK